jgi:hypothetical protein
LDKNLTFLKTEKGGLTIPSNSFRCLTEATAMTLICLNKDGVNQEEHT